MGTNQADLALGAESVNAGEALADGDPISSEREAPGVNQAGPGEAEPSTDVGASQTDLALGAEPPAEQALVDGKPVGVERNIFWVGQPGAIEAEVPTDVGAD